MGDFELSTLLYGVAQTLNAAKKEGAGEVSSICLTPQLWMRLWHFDELGGWNLERNSSNMEMALDGCPLVSEPFMPLGKDYYVTYKLPEEKPESIIKAEPVTPGTTLSHEEFLAYLEEMRKMNAMIDNLLTFNQDNFEQMPPQQQQMILNVLVMSRKVTYTYTAL
ncbi:hypothetical protein D3C71_448840 [compost metagenome]